MINKVFSLKEPKLVNGTYMSPGDFGIVRGFSNQEIKEPFYKDKHVLKTDKGLICLEDGVSLKYQTDYEYQIELKDNLKLQRVQK